MCFCFVYGVQLVGGRVATVHIAVVCRERYVALVYYVFCIIKDLLGCAWYYQRFYCNVCLSLVHLQHLGVWEHSLDAHHLSITVVLHIDPYSISFFDTTVFKGPTFASTGQLNLKMYFKPTNAHAPCTGIYTTTKTPSEAN